MFGCHDDQEIFEVMLFDLKNIWKGFVHRFQKFYSMEFNLMHLLERILADKEEIILSYWPGPLANLISKCSIRSYQLYI